MSTDRDLDTTRIVRSWLRADQRESADRVLDEVFALLDATPQRRSSPVPTYIHLHIPRVEARLAIWTAAVAVLLVAIGLAARGEVRVVGPATTPPPTPSASSSATPRLAEPTAVSDAPLFGSLPLGPYEMTWPGGPADARIQLTIPADDWWWLVPHRSYLHKSSEGRLYGFPAELETHTVRQVVTSICALDEATGEVGPAFADVGPTVDDLVSAIRAVDGTSWSDPTDIVVGGHRGKRVVTTHHASCPGPAERTIWDDPTGFFFVEEGMRSTIDILDVDGNRLVLTENVRTSDPAILQELDAIVASIDIVRDRPPLDQPTLPDLGAGRLFPRAVGPDADLRVGRHRAVIEGIPFTFEVSEPGWESQRGFYLSKSITGPQGAEGTIRWTTIPNGDSTDPCPAVLDDSPGRSVRELAAAVASAPGIKVVEGPADAIVSGRPAAYVAVQVERDLGCDPGYFYTYEPVDGGALWVTTKATDRISVWIVDVDGKILFIETEAVASAAPILAESFRQMVDSMEFE